MPADEGVVVLLMVFAVDGGVNLCLLRGLSSEAASSGAKPLLVILAAVGNRLI